MRYLLTCLSFLMIGTLSAQDHAAVIDAQLKAYNARDIEAFLATYSEYVEVYEYGHDRPFAVGKDQLRVSYGAMFAKSPNLKAEVSKRIVQGHRVIDHETAYGINDGPAMTVVVIYEVTDGLINKVTFMY